MSLSCLLKNLFGLNVKKNKSIFQALAIGYSVKVTMQRVDETDFVIPSIRAAIMNAVHPNTLPMISKH